MTQVGHVQGARGSRCEGGSLGLPARWWCSPPPLMKASREPTDATVPGLLAKKLGSVEFLASMDRFFEYRPGTGRLEVPALRWCGARAGSASFPKPESSPL